MTNKTISSLSSASTIVGTEVLPIVQSSATVKVSVANLTSGLGTIIPTKGGTGLTSFTANGVMYASSTSALATGSVLTFDGTTLTNNGNTVLGNAGTNTVLMNAAPSIGGTGYGMGMGFRNRIINGAMVINQRGFTGAITNTSNTTYTLDRWYAYGSVASKFTVAQSSTAPLGFNFSLLATSSSAYTVGASELFILGQSIEGFNTADLAWGTASAKTVTLSFQVYSSLTGTFGGSILNSAQNRSYPFTYTISAANTWTQISITIAGDTSGTWIGATNGVGLKIYWGLGVGSTYSGTAGSWAGATYFSATGATSVVATNAATFYITGVQLEKGSTATNFDYRPYGTELGLCQAYFQITTIAGRRSGGFWIPENMASSNSMRGTYQYPVTMRASPTGTITQNYVDGGYAGQSYTFDDGLYSGLNQNAAVLLTSAYFVGGAGNYGTFLLTISLSAEL
jgi:hypothetical protein